MSSVLMDGQVFDNEISFCKVYTQKAKQELERAFLRHRVSYFVEWQDKGFWQRIFAPKGDRISCTIRINKADYQIARELVRGIKDIKIRSPRGIQERDTVKDLAKKKAAKEDGIRRAKPSKPVIIKSSSGKRVSSGNASSRPSSSGTRRSGQPASGRGRSKGSSRSGRR